MPANSIARVSLLALALAVTFSPAPAQAEEVVQIDGGSAPSGRICGGQHWHGFPGRESAVVGAIIGFASDVC